MMCETPYIYTPEIAQKDFERKANNCNRVWFAILLDDIVIGNVYLKNIDLQKGSGTLFIVLIQDCYKEKGYGTAVERTVLEYGFKELGLSVIYADVVLRNTRSQHVLEKIGFEYLHEDSFFKYYKSTRHFPACSHNFPKAGEARFQGLSRLFRLLGKFPYLGESRRILMAVSSKTSSKTRFCYAATRRISSAAV